MFSVLLVVLPTFALVLAGWLARRLRVLGPAATTELNRFVVYLALPALLIDIVANAAWREIRQPGLIVVFGLASLLLFGATVALRRRSHHLADAAIDGLNAAYANTGFMGFPLTLAVFGPSSRSTTLIVTMLTVCVVFGVALVLIEVSLHHGQGPWKTVRTVAHSLARNPLLVSPLFGMALLLAGVRPTGPAQSFLTLLGGAASPCALVALGLFLGNRRAGPPPPSATIAGLVALKLVAHPVATWVLAAWVVQLDSSLTRQVVLLAALPTGTGSFMLAEFHGREAALTSRVVLVSTVASVVSVTLYLTIVGR